MNSSRTRFSACKGCSCRQAAPRPSWLRPGSDRGLELTPQGPCPVLRGVLRTTHINSQGRDREATVPSGREHTRSHAHTPPAQWSPPLWGLPDTTKVTQPNGKLFKVLLVFSSALLQRRATLTRPVSVAREEYGLQRAPRPISTAQRPAPGRRGDQPHLNPGRALQRRRGLDCRLGLRHLLDDGRGGHLPSNDGGPWCLEDKEEWPSGEQEQAPGGGGGTAPSLPRESGPSAPAHAGPEAPADLPSPGPATVAEERVRLERVHFLKSWPQAPGSNKGREKRVPAPKGRSQGCGLLNPGGSGGRQRKVTRSRPSRPSTHPTWTRTAAVP